MLLLKLVCSCMRYNVRGVSSLQKSGWMLDCWKRRTCLAVGLDSRHLNWGFLLKYICEYGTTHPPPQAYGLYHSHVHTTPARSSSATNGDPGKVMGMSRTTTRGEQQGWQKVWVPPAARCVALRLLLLIPCKPSCWAAFLHELGGLQPPSLRLHRA